MQIFMSWSGERSKEFAELLKSFLQSVIQATKPWLSDNDIDKGAVWFTEIYAALEKSNFGILCVTADNIEKPWLLFEAGALAKGMSSARVCPVLVDLPKSSVSYPLAAMQMASASNESEMQKLIESINTALGEKKIEQSVLLRTFKMWWPDFEEKLKAILQKTDGPTKAVVKRPLDEMMAELLSLMQSQNQRLAAIDAKFERTETPKDQDYVGKFRINDGQSIIDLVGFDDAKRRLVDALIANTGEGSFTRKTLLTSAPKKTDDKND